MKLEVDSTGLFYWVGGYDTKDYPKEARFKWNVSKRVWETKNIDSAERLYKFASQEAKDAIDKSRQRERDLLKLSSSKDMQWTPTDSEIQYVEPPCPEGKSFYNYQKVGINYALLNKNVLIADEMGLGKTPQAIGVINCNDYKSILIVCTSTLKYNWKKELEAWLTNRDYTISILSTKDTKDPEANIYIINYDILHKDSIKWIHKKKFDIIIADEAHNLKNGKTHRSKFFKKIKKNSGKVLLLTGTPSLNRPIELYNLLTILNYDISWFDYIYRYCDAQETDFGMDYKGASNLDELQYNLRKSVMIRRLKADVLPELPDKIRELVYIDPNSKPGLKNIVNSETAVIPSNFRNIHDYDTLVSHLTSLSVDGIQTMATIRKDTGVAKIPDAIEEINAILESSNKVVVFAHHRDVIEAIYNHYGSRKAVRIYGGTPDIERYKSVNAFQTDPDVKIFIGSIRAAGVGITLTAADVAIFVEMDWTPGIMQQAGDRLHRIGQKSTVYLKYLVVDGTIDAHLAKTLLLKESVSERIYNVENIDNYIHPEVDKINTPVRFYADITGEYRQYSYIEKLVLKNKIKTLSDALSPDSNPSEDALDLMIKANEAGYIFSNQDCKNSETMLELYKLHSEKYQTV